MSASRDRISAGQGTGCHLVTSLALHSFVNCCFAPLERFDTTTTCTCFTGYTSARARNSNPRNPASSPRTKANTQGTPDPEATPQPTRQADHPHEQMGVSTTHKTRGDGGKKKTASSSRNRLQGKIDSALSVQRSHVIQKHFRRGCLDGALRPPSGQKVHSVVERASWLATPSNFAFDQIAGGIYCAAIGMDEKPTGETWAFTFRGEEELLPRQFRLGSKRSRDDSSSEGDNSASEDEAPAVEEEEQALVPAAPTPSRKSSKSSRSAKKSRQEAPPPPPPPPAPKKKPRRNEPSRRRHGRDQNAEDGGDGDTTETEASHLARTRQHKEGDQVLVASTLGSSQAGSSSSPNRTAEDCPRSSGSDGEQQSLGRGKRITSGPYGRAPQKRKTSSSPPRSDKVPRPKQRDTVLADPLNAYNHEFETPAFQGRKGDRRAESVTGESEVARLCARVDHLGVRSANGGSVVDGGEFSSWSPWRHTPEANHSRADTVRGSPAPTVDMDEPAAASSSSSTAMTRSASKGKGRAL